MYPVVNRLLVAAVAIVFLISPFLMVPQADAADPGYQDPPAADYEFQIAMYDLTSNTPTQRVIYDMRSQSDAYLMAIFVAAAEAGRSGYSVRESHLLPSWVTWSSELQYDDIERARLMISISPALQDVAEDTVGDYWIWFRCTHPQGFGSSTDTFLIRIHLEVSWAGSVIVPDETYHTYSLSFDSQGGSINTVLSNVVLASVDPGVSYFDTSALRPEKQGYTFKGWSTMGGVDQRVDVSNHFPFASSSAQRVDSSDPMNIVYHRTVYAVWEENKTVLPDSLKDAAELLTDPKVVVPSALFLLGLAFFVGGHNKRRS